MAVPMSVAQLVPSEEPPPATANRTPLTPSSNKKTYRCSRCGLRKPREQFSLTKPAAAGETQGPARLYKWCSPCRRKYRARWLRAHPLRQSPAAKPAPPTTPPGASLKTRRCSRCGRQAPEEQFSLVKRRRTGGRVELHRWCDTCLRKYKARWMRKFRFWKRFHLRRKDTKNRVRQ
jgi:hypothetical protein